MPSINDPWLSNFERRELLRAGEPSYWIEVGERDEELFCFEGRHPVDPAWRFVAKVDTSSDELPLVYLSLDPATLSPPSSGLTTETLRNVRTGDLHATARQWLALPPAVGPGLRVDRDALGHPRRPGRRGRPDVFYAQWAARYVRELVRGGDVIERLARRHHFSTGTVRHFLQVARERDLLTKAPPGRAGGQLTEKAISLLRDQESTKGDK